jgi:SPOR domain
LARFFFGVAARGRLRLRDINGTRWTPQRIAYWDETYIDGVARLAAAGEKIRSPAELAGVIERSLLSSATRPLWLHEELIEDVRRCLETQRAAVKRRRRVRGPVMIAAGVAAALAAGLIAFAEAPPDRGQRGAELSVMISVMPAVRVESSRARRAPAEPLVRTAGPMARRIAFKAADIRKAAAYTVSVGSFANAAWADNVKHVVRGKGYIVDVVSRGGVSQVTTRPYRTRAQAERIVRGLEAVGVRALVLAWRVP